jgi:hypothetical protein
MVDEPPRPLPAGGGRAPTWIDQTERTRVMNPYAGLCDDFGISAYLASKLELPTGRDTVLHFFESVRKRYPTMTDFEKRDGTEYALEEDRDAGAYRWVTVDGKRLGSGCVNPQTLEAADAQNLLVLDMAPFHMGMHPLDTDSLDVMYYFDLTFKGNHDEVVADALAGDGPFDGLFRRDAAKVLNYQPSVMIALDEGCQLQARLSVETRTTAYQVRTGTFPEAPISVYLTVRQFWARQPFATFTESYHKQRQVLDELTAEYLLPSVIQPLQRVIATKS